MKRCGDHEASPFPPLFSLCIYARIHFPADNPPENRISIRKKLLVLRVSMRENN